MILDRTAIFERIPHRPPFLFIDQVDVDEEGVSGTGLTFVGPDDPVFAGHFPDEPILPGVLLIECIAQVAAVLFSPPRREGAAYARKYFAKVEQMVFKRPVRPGATLRTHVRLFRRFGRLIQVVGRVEEDGALVAKGDLVLCDTDVA